MASALAQRVLEPELMDDPALDAAEHRRALAGLRLVNRASSTASQLWSRVRPLAAGRAAQPPVRVLDVATGSGDVPRRLAELAAREGLEVSVDGCDVSARAIREAVRLRASAAGRHRFFELDAVREELPRGYDVITCALFMHHLATEQAAAVLAKMRDAAGVMVLVSDLQRTRAGLALAWLASRVFTTSRVMRADALLSVRAAFTVAEFAQLAAQAGMAGARIDAAWPQRFMMEWRRA